MDGTPFGRYRLVELLGRGGMGEVWRAFDTETDRIVAVKVLREEFAHDEQYQARFRREARAAAALNEPHVVPIHNFGDIEGRLYVDMRLIHGSDLDSMLEAGPLDPARAVGIVKQIASALNAAHQTGLIHRDVKPSNILVARDDFSYLIDFGIARSATDTGLTNTGAMVGTFAYMAPERFTSGIVDARADVYALACVLHQALTGQQPYPGDSVEQQVAGHMMVPPPRPSAFRTDMPAELDAVIASGLAKDPMERFPTATDLAIAASAALTSPLTMPLRRPTPAQGAPTYTGPLPTPQTRGFDSSAPRPSWSPPAQPLQFRPTMPPPPEPPWWRRPAVLSLFAAAVVVAIVAVVVAVSVGGDTDRPITKPGTTTGTTSTTTTTTTSSGPTGPNIDTLLLSPPEINAIMDATGMTVNKGGTGLLEDEASVTPPECRAVALIAGRVTFDGTPLVDSRFQSMSESGPTASHSLFQHIAEAQSAQAATTYFDDQTRLWEACQNRPVTTTSKLTNQAITSNFLGLVRGDGRITITSTVSNITCQRTLGIKGAYLADASACSATVTNQADTVVTAILDKIAT